MTSRQLEIEADEARSEAQARTEALDQREAGLSGTLDDLDQQIAELQRENKRLTEKLDEWNEREKNACKAISDCLTGITKVLDIFKEGPSDW